MDTNVTDAHPATALFPMMSDSELAELAADIAEHGQQMPIVLHEGLVLDGRNRLAACKRAGTEPITVEWDEQGGSAVAFVLSTNLHRRHLTAGQRAAVAAELLPMLELEAKDRQREHGGTAPGRASESLVECSPPVSTGKSRDHAAALVDVNPRYVSDAKAIKEESPELFEQVKAGEMTIPAAIREIRPPAPRDETDPERVTVADLLEDGWTPPPPARLSEEQRAYFAIGKLSAFRHLDPEMVAATAESSALDIAVIEQRKLAAWIEQVTTAIERRMNHPTLHLIGQEA